MRRDASHKIKSPFYVTFYARILGPSDVLSHLRIDRAIR